MAHRFGWKVGQHVTLQCFVPRASGTPDWEFDIVGELRRGTSGFLRSPAHQL